MMAHSTAEKAFEAMENCVWDGFIEALRDISDSARQLANFGAQMQGMGTLPTSHVPAALESGGGPDDGASEAYGRRAHRHHA